MAVKAPVVEVSCDSHNDIRKFYRAKLKSNDDWSDHRIVRDVEAIHKQQPGNIPLDGYNGSPSSQDRVRLLLHSLVFDEKLSGSTKGRGIARGVWLVLKSELRQLKRPDSLFDVSPAVVDAAIAKIDDHLDRRSKHHARKRLK